MCVLHRGDPYTSPCVWGASVSNLANSPTFNRCPSPLGVCGVSCLGGIHTLHPVLGCTTGTNPCGTSGTIGFYRFFGFLKSWSASLRIMVVFGATPAGVPLAYADSPSREHARPTIICTALVFLRLSVLRCSCHPQRCAACARARPRAWAPGWARSSMAAAAAATGGITAGLGEPPGRGQLCHTAVDGTM